MQELVEQLKKQIISTLCLEGKTPDQIDPRAPLFAEGLGLDSIDALELVVMLEKHYGIRVTDMAVGRRAFASVEALAAFIKENQKPCPPP